MDTLLPKGESGKSGSAVDAALPYLGAAFGCAWRSNLPLTEFSEAHAAGSLPEFQVEVRATAAPEVTVLGGIRKFQRLKDGLRYTSSEMVVDLVEKRLSVYLPALSEPVLPPAFFASVAALAVSRRGSVPMHGTAVELFGGAVLLCGEKGAGKSSLAAALVASGARLISDDLSVLQPERGRLVLSAGRRAIRLFPDVAAFLGERVALTGTPVRVDQKLAIVPPRVPHSSMLPLSAVVVLTRDASSARLADRAKALEQLLLQTYRPQIMKEMPGYTLRKSLLGSVAETVPLSLRPQVQTRSVSDFEAVAVAVRDEVAQLTGQRGYYGD